VIAVSESFNYHFKAIKECTINKEITSDTRVTVGLWCNATFGLHVRSTPYLPFVFVHGDVKNDVIVYLQVFLTLFA